MSINLKILLTLLVLTVVSFLVRTVLKNAHRKEIERWYYGVIIALLLSFMGFLSVSVFVIIWMT
ncbi:MAG: hypothetical protein JRI45_06635 [Deltaproteobacteria bacterium]|nr:hypothetical protein [Deltaproteobacteria bacterium]